MCATTATNTAIPRYSCGASCTSAVAITATSSTARITSTATRAHRPFVDFIVTPFARRVSCYALAWTQASIWSVLLATLSPGMEKPSRMSDPGQAAARSDSVLAKPLPACVLKG